MSKKIMIVDDEADVVETVKLILESEGYDTMHAYNGMECLEKLENEEPDLILLDIMMQPMNGWEVLRQIKSNEKLKDIPVSMLTVVPLTAENFKDEKIESIENYIIKPFSKKGLLEKVRELLKMEEKVGNVAEMLKEKVGEDIAKNYEKLVKEINRHRKLIGVLRESTKGAVGLEKEAVEGVIKSRERMIEINKKRLEAIKKMANIEI